MKIWEYIILFGLGLGMTLIIASAIQVPGYMDAEYYYAGGLEIASGKGFYEPFIWNYLDDPSGLPHPAATYWMPLASLVSAAGILLTGVSNFVSARLFFFILAGLVPVITAWLAYKLSQRRVTAWIAGGLAVFSGFYAVYLGLTETFALCMLLGSLFLVAAVSDLSRIWKAVLLGLLAGLFHLARADGLLWAVTGGICLIVVGRDPSFSTFLKRAVTSLGIFVIAYLLVMDFWYARNIDVFGAIFPPGTNRVMWLVNYDQLYNFPVAALTFQNWLAAGFSTLFALRWDALLENLQTLIAVQGGVFLLPLILVGGWRYRYRPLVWLGSAAWLITFLTMTIVFPLAGSRGGFLHSGAAFQPLFWGLAAEGLAGFVDLGVKWRNWKFQRAMVGFGIIFVTMAGLLTLGLTAARIYPYDKTGDSWSAGSDVYKEVDAALQYLSVPQADVIMVNNPPGFFVTTGRPAVVIPNGDFHTVLAAATKYKARYLVLEKNTVKGLLTLYQHPVDLPGLKYLETVGQTRIFQITNP